jgi:hypothetical protein
MRPFKIAIAATVSAIFVIAGAGCGEKEAKPLDTKDLPENMVTKPGENTPAPRGNTFRNPRDAGGGAGKPAPQGR